MKNLDLRQVGTIMGLPLYVDVASVRDFKKKHSVVSEREMKALMVGTMLKRAFEMSEPTDEEVKRYADLDADG